MVFTEMSMISTFSTTGTTKLPVKLIRSSLVPTLLITNALPCSILMMPNAMEQVPPEE